MFQFIWGIVQLLLRHNLGCEEEELGNIDRAFKHWMIAANAGFDVSMKAVRDGYKHDCVTTDDLVKSVHAYSSSVDEMKSDQRAERELQYASRDG